MNVFGNANDLELEACKFSLEMTYLRRNFPLDEGMVDDQMYYQCLKNPAKINLKPNQTMKTALEIIRFSVDICQNMCFHIGNKQICQKFIFGRLDSQDKL